MQNGIEDQGAGSEALAAGLSPTGPCDAVEVASAVLYRVGQRSIGLGSKRVIADLTTSQTEFLHQTQCFFVAVSLNFQPSNTE